MSRQKGWAICINVMEPYEGVFTVLLRNTTEVYVMEPHKGCVYNTVT